jgi:hypothetical protein
MPSSMAARGISIWSLVTLEERRRRYGRGWGSGSNFWFGEKTVSHLAGLSRDGIAIGIFVA